MGRKTAVSVPAAVLVAAGLAGAVGLTAHRASSHGPVANPVVPGAAHLASYTGCGRFLSAVKTRALQQVGPYGLPGDYTAGSRYATAGPAMQSSAADAAAPAAASSSGGSFSTTNDQVAGVDEPDTVKTNGAVMAVLRTNPVGLEIVTVGGLVPRQAADLPLPGVGYPTGMFLTGGVAVVLSQGPPRTGPTYTPTSMVTVVSLADPSRPSITRSFTITGTEVAARLIGRRVILVVRHSPALRFAPPVGPAPSPASSTEANRAVIESSTVADWLPVVTTEPAGRTAAVGCDQAWLIDQPGSSLATVSVVSIDPSSAQLGPSASVVGSAGAVYASGDTLYVASPDYPGAAAPAAVGGGVAAYPPGAGSTSISEFDLSDPASVRLVGSATVAGQLIGQYAMDEYHQILRVATTTGQTIPPPGEGQAPTQLSDSRITDLAPSGGALVAVGTVSGLGSGEKIYSVRFEGPLAYVVTFRQTDPLYVVDLSDPARPVQKGQLDLTGFSSFLQPLSGPLLLGVGQSVDGNLRQSGLQLSVFDVAVPSAPALESRVELPGGYSGAQYDPHALLWWPRTRLVAMPVSDPAGNFDGVAVWRVDAEGSLHQVARLSPPSSTPPSSAPPPSGGSRSAVSSSGPAVPVDGPVPAVGMPAIATAYGSVREVVVGTLLYTVWPQGIMASDMTTSWNTVAWLPFR